MEQKQDQMSRLSFVIIIMIAFLYSFLVYRVLDVHMQLPVEQLFVGKMVLSILGVFAGARMGLRHEEYRNAGFGVAVGSCITMIGTMLSNWRRFGTELQTAVVGGGLVALVYGSSKLA